MDTRSLRDGFFEPRPNFLSRQPRSGL